MRLAILQTARMTTLSLALLLVSFVSSANAQNAPPQPDPDGEIGRVGDVYRQSFNESKRSTGEDVRGRQEWFRAQRSFPYDRIPAGARVAALRDLQEMQARIARIGQNGKGGALLAQNRWQEIGPANQAGRARGIAIDPVNQGTLYIAAAAGGVWKTTDNGGSWITTTDTLSSLSSGAVAIDPTNPNAVYFGTGENTNNIDRYDGDGIFRSTDGGQTWKNIGLNSVGAISKIHVRSDANRTIYVAGAQGGGGFYRSTDGGANWTRLATGTIYDMAVNPSNQAQIYIAGSNTLRRSDNGGESFVAAQSGMTLSGAMRISVAVAPSSPNIVYALVARSSPSGGNHIGEVYMSTDFGSSWTLTKTMPTSFFNEQGWYDNCIAIDPSSESTILVGGIDIYRSLDGGANFTNTTRSYNGGVAHPDQHVIAFDPNTPGLAFVGNDGGIFASLDAGGNWEDVSKKMPTSQYYAMDVDQTRPFRVYGGTQDNGSHGSYGTTGFVDNWSKVLSGDGFFVVVDLSNPDIIYAENFNGAPMYRIDANNVSSRVRIDGAITSAGDAGFWSTPIAMSPADKTSLYTGRTGLWRSTNRGSSWEMLTPGNGTGSGGKITAIGLSPHVAGKIAVGTYAQGAYYSTDNGVTWAKSAGLPNRFVTDIRYDPVDANRVYLTVSGLGSGHVYRSEDNGATFRSITSNLPDIPANAIEIDPNGPNTLFLGTDIGVFVSLDGGGYWFPYNEGLALSPVVSMKIHRSSRTLVAATHGRSMFRVSIDNIQPVAALISPIGGENFTTPRDLEVRWAGWNGPARVLLSYDGGMTWNQMSADVNGVTATIAVPLARTDMARIRVESGDGSVRLESGNFTLTATTNISSLPRSFKAEAIAVRGREIWATSATSDSIYRLNLPLLTNVRGFMRGGLQGRIRSMAYDARLDRFYALVANADFSGARLVVMDTSGNETGAIPLPASSIMSVSDDPEGVAVATADPAPTVYVLDTAGNVLSQYGPLENAGNDYRRGLQWDMFGYVQGVTRTNTGPFFASELQHLTRENEFRVRENALVVPQSTQGIYWVDLTADLSDTNVNNRSIWATDTAGAFHRFVRGNFFTSGVDGGALVFHASGLAIVSTTPNPMNGSGSVVIRLATRALLDVGLFDHSGRRVAEVFHGAAEAGDHTISIVTSGVPSGIYYLCVETRDGRRDVVPLVVVR